MSTTSEELLNAIKSYATGVLKGNTADTLGAPVDIINEAVIRPIATALGMEKKVSKEPVGGSKSLRKMMGMSAEDSNIAETIGSLLSVGGAAKAIIVPAMTVRSLKEVREAEQKLKVYSDEEVFKTMGMYKPPSGVDDGVLRAVISDQNAKLKFSDTSSLQRRPDSSTKGPEMMISMSFGKKDKLGDILDHPELFAAVPDLKDVSVGTAGFGQFRGAFYSGPTDYIGMGADNKPNDFLSTLLHETQHAIQTRFGMNNGGSPANFVSDESSLNTAFQRVLGMNTEAAAKARAKAKAMGVDWNYPTKEFLETTEARALKTTAEAAKKLQDTKKGAYENYRSIYGEAEAFGTETAFKQNRPTTSYPVNYYENPREFIADPSGMKKLDDDPVIQAIIQSANRNPKPSTKP